MIYKVDSKFKFKYVGDHRIIHGTGIIITGNHNKVYGNHNEVYGNYNILTGNHNIIVGDYNTIVGNHNKLAGLANKETGSFNIVNGIRTYNSNSNIYVHTPTIEPPKNVFDIVLPGEDDITSNDEDQCGACCLNKKVVAPKCGHRFYCRECFYACKEVKKTKCPLCNVEMEDPRIIF